MEVKEGNLFIFGMSLPKALIIALLTAGAQALAGDTHGAVNTILIGVGVQKGFDSISGWFKK